MTAGCYWVMFAEESLALLSHSGEFPRLSSYSSLTALSTPQWWIPSKRFRTGAYLARIENKFISAI